MKERRSPLATLALIALGLLFVTSQAPCQQTSPPSAAAKSAAAPSTPSAPQVAACTLKNGRPCPKWLHRLIGPYPRQRGQDVPSISYWIRQGLQAVREPHPQQQSRKKQP